MDAIASWTRARSSGSRSSCMRFPRATRFAAVLAAAALPFQALGAADATKADVARRLQAQVPTLAPFDYGLGAAAFDADVRAANEAATSAAPAVLESGKKIWSKKFRNGKTLASCFPNGGRRIAANYPQYDAR